MKVAISAHQPSLESEIDPRFGRCRYFVLVDPQTLDFSGIENPNAAIQSGAGIGTAQFIVQQGAQAIFTGNLGPKAHQALAAAGIRMFTGVSGTIRQVIDDYNSGRLQGGPETTTLARNVQEMERASGAGLGRGRGGCGRGLGRGKGFCWEPGLRAGTAVDRDLPEEARSGEAKYRERSGKETLEELKARVSMLNDVLLKVQRRIREMEEQQTRF